MLQLRLKAAAVATGASGDDGAFTLVLPQAALGERGIAAGETVRCAPPLRLRVRACGEPRAFLPGAGRRVDARAGRAADLTFLFGPFEARANGPPANVACRRPVGFRCAIGELRRGRDRRASASPTFCSSTLALTAVQQDRLLRFAAIVRRELEGSGQRLALISRKGTTSRASVSAIRTQALRSRAAATGRGQCASSTTRATKAGRACTTRASRVRARHRRPALVVRVDRAAAA